MLDLGDGFPRPTNETRAAARTRLAALPIGPPIVIDGLAFGVLPEAAAALGATHSLVALVHHPLALEIGIERGGRQPRCAQANGRRWRARDMSLRPARTTARLLAADYDVRSERLSVVEPGTERVATRPRRVESVIALLAVGAVVPRKGYDVLVAALARLKHLPWRLVIAGDCGAKRGHIAPARGRHRRSRPRRPHPTGRGRDRRGACIALRLRPICSCCRRGSKATEWPMPKRIAHGLPVIGTNAGAIPETVPADAGVLVPPDDVDVLAATLRRLMRQSRRSASVLRRVHAPPRFRHGASRLLLFARVLESLRMSGFSAEWLALRERYDAAARNAVVLDAVANTFAGQTAIAVVDLACGTGSPRFARSGPICRRARAGGWSTTISVFSRGRGAHRGRRR